MVEYIARENIDEDKYNACIKNAENGLVYAYSWYLDAVCDNWDALVYMDYKAVMPLPNKKKFGLSYIYLPPWAQQLGIFFTEALSPETQRMFFKKIPRKFVFLEMMLNSKNVMPKGANERDNYLLPLHKTHEKLWQNFSDGRKHAIKKALKNDLVIHAVSTSDGLDLLLGLEPSTPYRFPEGHIRTLKQLAKALLDKNSAVIYHIYGDKELLGGALIAKDVHRLTYLFSVLGHSGRKKEAMSFLLDTLIMKHENSGHIFDFEGSMVPGIAAFFRSFGAVREPYYHLRKYRIF